jgi:hypothetical protein
MNNERGLIKKPCGLFVGKTLGQRCNALAIQHVGAVLFAVCRSQLQLGSGTNQLVALFFELGFEVFPVVADFLVIGLFVQHAHHIHHAEPPFGAVIVLNGTHLTVIKKADGHFHFVFGIYVCKTSHYTNFHCAKTNSEAA